MVTMICIKGWNPEFELSPCALSDGIAVRGCCNYSCTADVQGCRGISGHQLSA